MSKVAELERLERLYDKGALSMQEFESMKKEILEEEMPSSPPPIRSGENAMSVKEVNDWAMFMHLSQLIPSVGLIVAIVMWQIRKDRSPAIDQHGKNILNWIISVIIYGLICLPLCLIIIGIFLLMALAITSLVFVIMGAVKANEGVIWKYPLAIQFFK